MPNPALLASQFLPSIIGQNQLGPAAPAFQPGQMGLLGGIQQPNPIQDILGQIGGIDALQKDNPQLFNIPAPTPPEVEKEPLISGPEKKEGIKGFLSQFGKGIDSTLNSPSKQLGIGLLGQIDPRLGLAGLAAGGLFGGR